MHILKMQFPGVMQVNLYFSFLFGVRLIGHHVMTLNPSRPDTGRRKKINLNFHYKTL